MYYIIYPLFYLLSLLPWRLMYFLSDGIYALVYYVLGYRKEVVMGNLKIAFPEKSEKERVRIAKDFYHNLVDSFIETIKLISMSDRTFAKRYSANGELVKELYATGRNIQFHTAHFFNLEIANLGEARHGVFPIVVIYMPISNKAIDRIIYNLRTRYGSILIPATDMLTKFKQYVPGRYGLVLAADQNPANPLSAYWVPFFGRPVPFVTGPDNSARRNDTIVIFANFYKLKRGYFHVQYEVMTDAPKTFSRGQLTKLFAQKVEAAVRERPANYLWSHRRWRFAYDEEKYGKLLVK
jgi:KDO2-lipid IV(A) lauroyltransferase